MQGMFLIGSILLLSLPFVTHLIDHEAVTVKYWVVFVILLIYGPVNGVAQGMTFGLAGPLPSAYVSSVMVGNGLSGIGTTLVSLLLVFVLPGQDKLFT